MADHPCALRAVYKHLGAADRLSARGTCRRWRLVASDLSLGAEPTAVRFDASAPHVLPFFEYEQGLRMEPSEWMDGELEGCSCAPGACADQVHCPCNRHARGRGLIECGPACACARDPGRCPLRAVGSGARPALEVFWTGDARGWGVRATQPIGVGALVCEYGGELTHSAESRRIHAAHDRARAAGDSSPFFLMSVREEVGEAHARRSLCSFIDARWVGSVGRFLNHSCEPCLEARTVRIGHVKPRVAFFATRQVGPGEELTYDYGGCEAERRPARCEGMPQGGVATLAQDADAANRCVAGGHLIVSETAELQPAGIACLCMSSACRRFLPSM